MFFINFTDNGQNATKTAPGSGFADMSAAQTRYIKNPLRRSARDFDVGLYDALGVHGIGDLQEACNVCTGNVVAFHTVFLSSVI